MNRIGYPLSAVALAIILSGCGVFTPAVGGPPSLYALDSVKSKGGTQHGPAFNAQRRPTLIVNPTHAAAGYDSRRIIYVRKPHQLEYYAHGEWIDSPARMLKPLIVAAIEQGGAYQAVVLTPSAATGELRLDTEVVRLQHQYDNRSDRVRFTLHAYIVDIKSRQVLGWREFDESVDLESAGVYGAVVAANRAVNTALGKLTTFAQETAEHWRSESQ
jgi:cholesterol transport system auxiliary component